VSTIMRRNAIRPALDQPPEVRVFDVYDQFDFRVPRTVSLPLADDDIVQLPDPRCFRALSRAGLMLNAAGLPCRDVVAPFVAEDPFCVGVYAAMQNGPEDYHCAKQMVDTPREDFARTYKFLRSSKQFFRQIPNIPPAMLSIFLGAMGPQYVFSHSRWACLHALEQAEFDLHKGIVRAAVVCSAFSLEDPLLTMRIRRSLPDGVLLCEGAAALVLLPSSTRTAWRQGLPKDDERFYGTAHDLVLLAAPMEVQKETYEKDHGTSKYDHDTHVVNVVNKDGCVPTSSIRQSALSSEEVSSCTKLL
jgi:hypothetical protein